MQNVMIDLETLGTADDAAIISIGACAFDLMSGDIGNSFYTVIDWESAMKGRSVSASTLQWWFQQEDAARLGVISGDEPFSYALQSFKDWLPKNCIVWGNGATFDISILTTAYNNNPPWGFRDVRDMRTIKALGVAGDGEVSFIGTRHNALDDAVWQAKYVALAWSRIQKLYSGEV